MQFAHREEGTALDKIYVTNTSSSPGNCGVIVNQWIGNHNSWDNISAWSLNHVPLTCERVLISNSSDIVTMPENYQATMYTLDVKLGAQLIIPETSMFTVVTEKQSVTSNGCH